MTAETLDRPKVNRWIVAIAVMSSAVMEVLDTSVVNVSLPHIAGSLSVTVDEATWVLTSYLVANAIILPITGWLAASFGRKRLLMTVVSGFTLSSILCGLAPNLPALVFFRIMQGTTGGGLQPLSQAVLLEEFPPEERGKAMAFWGVGIVVMPILGPIVGGWLTDTYSWRWVFYINVPIGLLSLVLINLFIWDPPYLRRKLLHVDFWGLGMLAVGIAALQIMLDKGQEDDWFASHLIVVLAVVAVAVLTLFVIHELRTKQPIVHLRLLSYRTFAAGVGLITVLGVVLYGSLVVLPLFLQTLMGYSAETAGMLTSPRGIGTMIFMPIAGILLSRRWDARILITTGLLLSSTALLAFSHLTLDAGVWHLVRLGIWQGTGLALIFVPLTTATMDPIPQEEMGFAASIYSLTRNIGGSIGIAFSTTLIARRSQFHQSRLASEITGYGQAAHSALAGAQSLFLQHGSSPTTAAQQAMAELYGIVRRQAAYMSYLDVFHSLALAFLTLLPIVWIMRKPRTGRKVPVVE
ncbi:MAG TPA: DHA2 family efflux MFS transporter permease subunit [Vicinamibacterales bacterium]|nr:DHA2 family efflux MFS transporter permease subunit [Vicinamibacterales bacterium]